METLLRTFHQRLNETPAGFVRYLHDGIAWESQLVAILGARGVGKSTLMLQHIRMHEDIGSTLYVSADDIYFSSHNLTELAHEFYVRGGKALYIDEIHQYKGWSTEVKNICDTYSGLRIVYSGSSILELEKGGGDLSRRKLEYRLPGLSFREYLALSGNADIPVHTLEQVLSHKVEFPYGRLRPVAMFDAYMKEGYYPYFQQTGYTLRLQSVINRVLENDIRDFSGMSVSTARALKKLMYIISQSAPFKPNISKIAMNLGLNRQLVSDLLVYLEKAQLVSILRDSTGGISALGKVDKVYLDNTNLAYALAGDSLDTGNARETVFLSMMRPLFDITSAPSADFKIGKYTFEVGGRNKKQHQISGIDNAFIVKDDIEYCYANVVPLWAFGLLY